jgi:hypothetical protein
MNTGSHLSTTFKKVIFLALLGLFLVSAGSASAATILDTGTSENWSGYVSGSGTYTSVSGTWTIPYSTSNTNSSADATWVGIGGVTTNDLIQVGTLSLKTAGQFQYQTWIELLPANSVQLPVTVKPGDSVHVSITETAVNTWNISFQDYTTGQSYQQTISYTSTLSSAEWVQEMVGRSSNGAYIPLNTFGSVQFTNTMTTKNGGAENLTQSGAKLITMINGSGQAVITPSLIGADSQSFTAIQNNASASVVTTPAPTYTAPAPTPVTSNTGTHVGTITYYNTTPTTNYNYIAPTQTYTQPTTTRTYTTQYSPQRVNNIVHRYLGRYR